MQTVWTRSYACPSWAPVDVFWEFSCGDVHVVLHLALSFEAPHRNWITAGRYRNCTVMAPCLLNVVASIHTTLCGQLYHLAALFRGLCFSIFEWSLKECWKTHNGWPSMNTQNIFLLIPLPSCNIVRPEESSWGLRDRGLDVLGLLPPWIPDNGQKMQGNSRKSWSTIEAQVPNDSHWVVLPLGLMS